MATGWVYHELYMWHDTGRATTASPSRGVKTAIDDPMAARAASVGGHNLQAHQDEIIRRAERVFREGPFARTPTSPVCEP